MMMDGYLNNELSVLFQSFFKKIHCGTFKSKMAIEPLSCHRTYMLVITANIVTMTRFGYRAKHCFRCVCDNADTV